MIGKGQKIYRTNENLVNRKVRIYGNSRMGYGGTKKECQDTYTLLEGLEQQLDYFAVYDGHGPAAGREASEFANNYIESYLEKNRRRLHDLRGNHKSIEKFMRFAFLEC